MPYTYVATCSAKTSMGESASVQMIFETDEKIDNPQALMAAQELCKAKAQQKWPDKHITDLFFSFWQELTG